MAKSLSVPNVQQLSLQKLIDLGHRAMSKAKLHPHFFGRNTLLENAQYLAFHALGLPYEYSNPKYLATKLKHDQINKILGLYERRIAERIPVEYLTNEALYLDRKFYVNENVLVPRSLMSTRFEEFLESTNWNNYRVLDLCTGSGCIGSTLALMHPKITVDLADISSAALEVAQININNYNLNQRVRCIQSNLFANINGKYDLIITNPPYVSATDYKKIPSEFKREPKIALECADNGLEIIDRILAQAPDYLNPNGQLIAEVGYASAKLIKQKYKHLPLQWYSYKKPGRQGFFDKYITPLVAMHGVFSLDACRLT